MINEGMQTLQAASIIPPWWWLYGLNFMTKLQYTNYTQNSLALWWFFVVVKSLT